MQCMLTVRRLKPGAEEEFDRVWAPDRWSPRMIRAYNLRRHDDPLEVITLAFFEGEPDEIESMRDEPQWMAGEERRLRRIAPLEETVGLTGVFEVVEEVQAASVRAHS
jgi:hypothetical protein